MLQNILLYVVKVELLLFIDFFAIYFYANLIFLDYYKPPP